MSKIAIVYWSGTGNTEEMATAVAEGVKQGGSEAFLLGPNEFTTDEISQYDGFAFGCSAQGAEVLEESEFEPMWQSVRDDLKGKKIALFGSYGWGGGEFMDIWKEDCSSLGLEILNSVVCQESPDDDATSECIALGKELA